VTDRADASTADDSTPRAAQRRATASRAGRAAPDPFGDVLPDGTRDEEVAGWGERGHDGDDDRLRREVPPHHG
jgi:hypothetical protein